MTAPRYAIYHAPAADTELWRFGSEVVGYDAATGRMIDGFAPAGFSPAQWRDATVQPRVYGFHATLKAPFRLNGQGEAELISALAAFTAGRAPVAIGLLAVTAIEGSSGHGFVALTPRRTPPELNALERDIVVGFDRFRAPATDEELAKRRPERLTERQRGYLADYGYPFVLDEFRFHMTLSGPLADAPTVADALADAAAARLGGIQLVIDALALFRQDTPDGPFRIIARQPLAGGR